MACMAAVNTSVRKTNASHTSPNHDQLSPQELMLRFEVVLAIFCLTLSACSDRYEFSQDTISIDCGAEIISDDQLVAGDYELGSIESRTSKKSRTGSYSLGLNAEKPEGFILQTKNIVAGSVFIISVWKELSSEGGQIKISGDGDEGGLLEQNNIITKKADGWGLIELHFTAFKNYDELTISVTNTLEKTVYFDDFSIRGYFNAKIKNTTQDALRIELSESALDSLSTFREEALIRGVISSDQKRYLKGTLTIDGEAIPMKCRLKGDWLDHVESNKWSLRIKVLGNNAYKGLKSFSIQNPSTRSFLNEWYAHKLFEHEDVLTTTYTFIPVIINGVQKGVYALEEHFDKQLLESRNRREGPIVKFDENGLWQQHEVETKEHIFYNLPTLLSADIKPFKKNRTYKSEILSQSFKVAQSHMDRYRNHDAAVEEYFDVDAAAKFLALSDVINGKHGLIWHNQRHYLNPITNKLEPIAFDCYEELDHASKDVTLIGTEWVENRNYNLAQALLSNDALNNAYLRYLKEYSSEAYISHITDSLRTQISKLTALLSAEYPYYKFEKSFFTSNAEQVKLAIPDFEKLRTDVPKELSIDKGSYDVLPKNVLFTDIALKVKTILRDSLHTELSFENYHSSKLKLIGYRLKKNDSLIYFKEAIDIDPFSSSTQSVSHTFLEKPSKIIYRAHNCGRKTFTQKVSKWSPPFMRQARDAVNAALSILKKGNQWVVPQGRHTISNDLTVPKGVTLIINAGTSFDLTKNAGIISYSPVQMNGTAASPIKFYSSDSTSSGVSVLLDEGASNLEYVNFDNLASMNRSYWRLTGAFTAYGGEITLSNCRFSNNRSEDAINIIRSKFTMTDCYIGHTFSDGLDADFCQGSVFSSSFEIIGNDGLDFSGSDVQIEGCTIINPGDKGISGGEKSSLVVKSCTIENAQIGIASKDLSIVTISDISLTGCHYGFAAYQKKGEYGPSELSVNSILKSGYRYRSLLQRDSEMIYLGKRFYGKQTIDPEMLL
ncbi:MAG: hypothetical protein ACI865_002939 [Flavobacteriaceae bacterium]|jgi:hypothetical protein